MHIPAVAGALARLVGKGAEVGEAWLDIPVAEGRKRAQAIRDDQAARTAMLTIIQEAAGGRAIQDSALLDRAISNFVDDRLRKQTNREAIAKMVVDDLKDDLAQSEDGPAEDWMNVFVEHAERASSSELRSLWSKVLSGEIRKRGSYSLRSLQFVSIVDVELAKSVEFLSGFLLSGSVLPSIDSLNTGHGFRCISDAISTNLLVPSSYSELNVQQGKIVLVKAASSHFLAFKAHNPGPYRIHGWTLTSLGREIFSLIETPLNNDLITSPPSDPFDFSGSKNVQQMLGTKVKFIKKSDPVPEFNDGEVS